MKIFLTNLFAGVMLVFAQQAYSQPVEEWISAYRVPQPGITRGGGIGVLVDSKGNIYALCSEYLNIFLQNTFIQKFSPGGNLIWTTSYFPNTNRAMITTGFALDGNDNLYLAGYRDIDTLNIKDIVIAKYDSSGNFVWDTTYNSGNYYHEWYPNVIVDAYNHIYVNFTGFSNLTGASRWTILRVSPAGQLLWVNQVDSVHGNNHDLATDQEGNVYAYGSKSGCWAFKYDSLGALKWQQQLGNFLPFVIKTDSSSVYLAGYADNSYEDIVVAKVSQQGVIQWTRTYGNNNTRDDQPVDMALDVHGNVYVTGYTKFNKDRCLVLKYSSSGTLKWDTVITNNQSYDERAGSIVADEDGFLYVAGGTYDINDPAFYLKLDSAGNVLLNQPVPVTGHANWYNEFGLAPASNNALAAVGSAYKANGSSAMTTVLLDKSFSKAWDRFYSLPSDITAAATKAVVDKAGNSYILGYEPNDLEKRFVVKIDNQGNEVWSTPYNAMGANVSFEDIVVDAHSNVYIAGTQCITGPFDCDDIILVKFDSTGAQQWMRSFDGDGDNDFAFSVALDGSGNILVAGKVRDNISNTDTVATLKYSPTGTLMWARTFPQHTTNYFATKVLADATDAVYVTGLMGTTISTQQFTTIKYDGSGNVRWIKYHGAGGFEDAFIDDSANIYITGMRSSFVIATTKYDSLGNQKWQRTMTLDSTFGSVQKIWVDKSHNVYVAGSHGYNGHYDIFIIKYDRSGSVEWQTAFNESPNVMKDVIGLLVDDNENVYLTGGSEPGLLTSYNDYVTAKYNANGAKVWERVYDFLYSSQDRPVGIGADSLGNLYVTGNIRFYNITTIKYVDYEFSITPLSSTTYCAGSSLNVDFHSNSKAHFTPGNTFYAQLSDASGSFSNPVTIGALSDTVASGTISCVIPANTPGGSGYRIRITGTQPEIESPDNGVNVTINALVTPAISIATNSTTTCEGANVTFTATATNGGTSPAFQWKKNGIDAGTNSATYTTNALVNTDVITCLLTGNAVCATATTALSNSLTMSVNPPVTPSVTISSGSTSICAGTSVVFSAIPVNGGTSPVYQWKKNGVNAGANSATFTNSAWADNDVISCVLTSNALCATPLTATSNSITMSVTGVTPGVTITTPSSEICSGDEVNFTATVTHGGPSPHYQWKRNGSNVGGNSSSYSTNALVNSDIISCVITSNDSCLWTNSATSNNVTMTVNNLPPKPVISQNGYVLSSSSGSGNQWLFNGSSITGASGQDYTVTSSGFYWVQVTDAEGCKRKSDSVYVEVTGIVDVGNGVTISTDPNPFEQRFMVNIGGIAEEELRNCSITVTNANGRIVLWANELETQTEINMSAAAPGIYFVQVKLRKDQRSFKMVKLE